MFCTAFHLSLYESRGGADFPPKPLDSFWVVAPGCKYNTQIQIICQSSWQISGNCWNTVCSIAWNCLQVRRRIATPHHQSFSLRQLWNVRAGLYLEWISYAGVMFKKPMCEQRGPEMMVCGSCFQGCWRVTGTLADSGPVLRAAHSSGAVPGQFPSFSLVPWCLAQGERRCAYDSGGMQISPTSE